MENSNEQIQEIEGRIKKAWEEIVAMEERLQGITGQADGFNDNIADLQKNLENSKDIISGINLHYSDYFVKADPTTKTKLEVVTEHHSSIEQFLKASTEIKKDLEEFRDFIYGSETLSKPGFKKDIESFLENSKKANEKLYKNWEESYETQYEKIEGLLPGATATGLSKAYQDQKTNYKLPVIMWSVVFGATVIGMMIFGIILYTNVKDLSDSLRHIVARLPFFLPAIWLAVFSSKQQSQYKRLQQEYVYKETLAKSYEAYKREIDLLPDGEEKNLLQQKLISSMVEMCGYNPSLTLEHKSHDDKPPIPGSHLIKNIIASKSKDDTTI